MTQADAAGTWTLGGDLEVPRMGFGAMQLGGAQRVRAGRTTRSGSQRALRTALELGVRHVDTSDYYGPYLVNELIRDTLHPYPEDLVLVTKIGGRRDAAGRWLPAALSPEEIRRRRARQPQAPRRRPAGRGQPAGDDAGEPIARRSSRCWPSCASRA